jgi:hypothetical protein
MESPNALSLSSSLRDEPPDYRAMVGVIGGHYISRGPHDVEKNLARRVPYFAVFSLRLRVRQESLTVSFTLSRKDAKLRKDK